VLDTGTDVVYIYDGLAGHSLGDGSWQCIEEREASGAAWTVAREHVYGAHYLDEIIATRESGSLTFYLQDTNYNVVALADGSGNVTERYWYEPYGNVTFADPTGVERTEDNALNKTLLFQGRRYDPETGFYYYRNRYYSPVLGRFLQRDPAGYQDGMSLYFFTSGSPTSLSDPLGLQIDELIMGERQRRDAFNTNVSAAARAAEEVIDAAVSLTPIGDASEALTGETITGKPVPWWGRVLAAIGLVPGAGLLDEGAGTAARVGRRLLRHADKTDEAADIMRTGRRAAQEGSTMRRAAHELATRPGEARRSSGHHAVELPGSGRPNKAPEHHFATNKSKKYTPQMEKIAEQHGLNLDDVWNKARIPGHSGRHADQYHEFVLEQMKRAMGKAGESVEKFLDLFERFVKKPVRENPELLRKKGWE